MFQIANNDTYTNNKFTIEDKKNPLINLED